MDEAIVVFSRKGLFQTRIIAREVRGLENAPKLWPLVVPGAIQLMVTWVNIHTQHHVLPKRVAEPINRLIKVVSNLQRGRDSGNALVEELG